MKDLCAIDKIDVIHCGISLNKLQFSQHKYQGGILRMVTIPSGFVEKKGLHILINTLRELLKSNLNIECLIIGSDSPKRKLYEHEVNNAGLLSCVKFLGAIPQKDLNELYKSCHIFALPCVVDSSGKMDGIPVSLMEAMAVGLPVISTKLSGIPELVEHGKQANHWLPLEMLSAFLRN